MDETSIHTMYKDGCKRALKPHHITPHDLPNIDPTLCLGLFQQKASEQMLIPLPPTAAAIWQRCGGQLRLPTQQERSRWLKALGRVVGLEREFVEVSFSGKMSF